MQDTIRTPQPLSSVIAKLLLRSANLVYSRGMDTITWLEEVRGEATYNALCTRAGITPSTLNRQIERGYLGAPEMVKIARSYKKDVLEALVISGLVSEDDIASSAQSKSLSEASDEEIAEEVWRRLVGGQAGETITGPIHSDLPPHLSVVPDSVAAYRNDGTHREFDESEWDN